ncbi:MAG: peptidase S8 and S53 subtilisin kexin sedolisin [Thiothrix lacustris]|uniref:Peptidase S8 and S53 subtilisin kexin sedolisin n=1 Tax=Thiothrix lacustris TaxID=525917 RepID=A0A1Y1QFA4_9GAMM|nr:MAG: peptidase S8 and S53 subtilisin kexin sedolisin [Thiothrix lacustris]
MALYPASLFLFAASTLALTACSPAEYKVIGKAPDSPACHLSSSICVETPVFRRVDYATDEMLITYDSQQPAETTDAVLKKYKLRAKRSDTLDSINTTMITAATNGQDPYDLVKSIKRNEKNVDASTSNFYTTAALNRGDATTYPLGLTGAETAQQRTSGNGVIIGMIDTPIDIANPSFGTNVQRVELIPAGDESNRLHGTEVAGIIASKHPRIGIAPDAQLIAISAFSTNPANPNERRSNSGLVARALQHAMDRGVHILNLSFAGGSDPVVDKLVAAALQKGIIVVASAGNEGPGAAPAYPAALPGVIAVTAVDKGESIFSRANRGDYIDLAAPGVSVLTTAPRGTFQISSGTSLATAHVTGVIALLKSLNPNFNPEALNATATDLGNPGHDQDYGYGLVNTMSALGAR